MPVRVDALVIQNVQRLRDIRRRAFLAGMGDGSINLFKGAITLQDGTVYVKDGATAAPKEIWYLPQLLQGMTGQSVQTK